MPNSSGFSYSNPTIQESTHVGEIVAASANNGEETLKKTMAELYQKLEEGFSAFMKVIMNQYGEQLFGPIKAFLECAICKEVLIQAISRKCGHTFCHHCVIQYLKSSLNCPICRNEDHVGAKNSWIDGVVDLLVGLTFTEEEKTERSITTQQRSTFSAHNQEDEMLVAKIQKLAIIDPNMDSTFVWKHVCFLKAQSLLVEISTSEEMPQLMVDGDELNEDFSGDDVDVLTTMENLLKTFCADAKSLMSILSSLP